MAPTSSPPDGVLGEYGDSLLSSAIVLGVIVAVAIAVGVWARWVGRRGAAGQGLGVLRVIARLPLEARRTLYVVEAADKTLLVGTSEMGLTVLTELDRDAVSTLPVAVTSPWADRLARFWTRPTPPPAETKNRVST